MHSTGLFPFKANWPELNKEKFKLADTLDRTKMDAKIAAHDAELSFSEGYRSFQISCNDMNASLTEVGPELKEIFPSLYASFNEFLLNRAKHEAVLKLGATIFRIPDNTKVRKTGPPRTNVIGEQFGQSRILNSAKRIEELTKYKEEADVHRKAKAEKLAGEKARKAGQLAEKDAKRRAEEPILNWLIANKFSPNGTKTITKKHMLAAFESKKGPITTRVRGGGDVIQKTTPMHTMKDLFVKYKVYE